MNHPTRTLYYHIQHLLRTGIQPLFIYDGPGKPCVKRHRHHRYSPTYVPYEPPAASSVRTAADVEREYDPQHVTHLSKQILDLLGIPWAVAPGEAEAACARLEQAGVVDAVLTRDGDAFVFGSANVLQRLDAENKVAVIRRFRVQDLREARPPLRHQDLLLLALMAGGDYDDGVPGCGPAVAIEAARAGYSGELWALLLAGRPTKAWRERLVDELQTNSKGRFSCRWGAVANAIPNTFPDPRIANYYLNPTVSSRGELEEVGGSINRHEETDVRGLRQWTAKYFDWKYAYHACKFVNNLTPALLARKLMIHFETGIDGSHLIRAIHGEKSMGKQGKEAVDDNSEPTLLLRVSYYPATVIDIDVSGEPVVEGYKANMAKLFDPQKEARDWIPMWMLERGAPTAFKSWKEGLAEKNNKKAPKKRVSAVDSGNNTPAKRPRGRPQKERSKNAESPEMPQTTGAPNDAPASNTPLPTCRKSHEPSSKLIISRLQTGHLHPVTSRTSAGSRSRSSAPSEFPDLAFLFGSGGRTTREQISYDAPARRGGKSQSVVLTKASASASQSGIDKVVTPSHGFIDKDDQSKDGADTRRRTRRGNMSAGLLDSIAADVIDLTSD